VRITVYRGSFELPENLEGKVFTLILHGLGREKSIYLDGKLLAGNVARENAGGEINLATDTLLPGNNVIAIVAKSLQGGPGNRGGGARRGNVGNPGQIRVVTPPSDWKRSLFSGLAQVIVQSTGQPGEITLTAKSPGMTDGVLKLTAIPTTLRPAIP
jgi:beta-galactosidase